MRVLVITSQFPLAGDPQRGRAVFQTVRQLARISDVSVLSPVAKYPPGLRPRSYDYRPAEAPADGAVPAKYVTFTALPAITRPFNGWLCARAIEREIVNPAPDVILSYWLYPDAYGALLVARRLGIPVVAGARGSDLRARDRLSLHMARKVVRAADRLLVVSDDLRRIAVERDGARAERVRVVRNGCDTEIFRLRDRADARRRLGVDRDAKLVLYVGRLVPEKGLRELMGAMELLRASSAMPRLAMAGDGPMRTELAERARRLGPGGVALLGPLAPRDVADWMCAADTVVLPSYSEGYPNVLVEALACGRPIVATPVGGVVEIADESCALTVRPGDAADLARGIQAVLGRAWDERALSARHAVGWDEVARQTLDACVEARQSRTH